MSDMRLLHDFTPFLAAPYKVAPPARTEDLRCSGEEKGRGVAGMGSHRTATGTERQAHDVRHCFPVCRRGGQQADLTGETTFPALTARLPFFSQSFQSNLESSR